MDERPERLTITNMPWRNGLLTAGQQTSVPEDALWQAQNVTSELDGLMSKRPGLELWGQAIKVPDGDATGSEVTHFSSFIVSTAGWVEVDTSSTLITAETNNSILRTNVAAGSSNEQYKMYVPDVLSSGSEWAIRFAFRGNNLPAYTASGTVANTIAIRGQGVAGSGKEFAIWSGGLYYQNAADDEYTLVTDSENVGAGGWNSIEIRVDDAAGNTTVYVNETLVDTIVSALIKDVSPTGTGLIEFEWEVEGTGTAGTQYSTQIVTPMYNDVVTDPFKAETIVAITDYQYITQSGSVKRALLTAAGDYIYEDNGLLGAWRPLKAKTFTEVHFSHFRKTIIWSDNDGGRNGNLWQWDGEAEPELLDDAPTVRFTTEHQQRLFAAGDRDNPLRLYYSADRQPNVWFSPASDNIEDEFDTLVDAGYLEVPSGRGDQITAVFGDYFGTLIVWTRRGAWRLQGHGLNSYSLEAVSQDVGCETHNAVTQVGNDLWFLSRQGVHSLQATDKFGDLQSAFPSAPIQDLWSVSPRTDVKISREYMHQGKLIYNPQQGLVYVALPLIGDITADNVFVYNVNTKNWYGPWTMENYALANVEVAAPTTEIAMHGDSSGRVGFTSPGYPADFETGAIEMVLESAMLTGRSLDPKLVGMMKTWKTLRLFVLPRGDWDFTVEYVVDTDAVEGPFTYNQNSIYRSYVLDEDFRLDVDPDATLRSAEEMAVIEIQLDVDGVGLSFIVKQSTAGEDFVIQGYEVDFTASGLGVN